MTETPRYYYDDPLEAAHMAKHFGIRLFIPSSDNWFPAYERMIAPDEWWHEIQKHEWGKGAEKYFVDPCDYLNPDGLRAFSPRIGDLYLITEPDDDAIRNNVTIVLDRNLCRKWDRRPIGEIIRRDGKPFFWPKSEAL